MSIPKFAGIETEFAITGGDPLDTSAAVVEAYDRVSLDADGTEGSGTANAFVGSRVDRMLPNGARYYVDHAHPEFSTAESADARVVVALERAGAEIVRRSAEAASRERGGPPIRIYKNNSDHLGHSYGCHENYLVEATTYSALFGPRSEWLHAALIPFLVSRIVIVGAGKVGAENGREPIDFQISQRADFLEELVGVQTTYARPIVNTRDEPHADPTRFRRLHVIPGDANMCPYAAWLKIGTMQIMLRLLEDGALRTDLGLADPLRAVRELSGDTSCTVRVAMADGRALSAVDMQMQFVERAHAYFSAHSPSEGEALVLQHWGEVLAALQADPEQLNGRLDWVTKRSILSSLMESEQWDWKSPQVLEADVKYHALAPEESLFGMLERRELIAFPPGWDPRLERLFLSVPPADSRAFLRGRCIGRFAEDIRRADWSEIVFHHGRLTFPALTSLTAAQVDEACEGTRKSDKFLDAVNNLAAAAEHQTVR